MAYLIYDIAKVIPEDYPVYFFDSNVWISGLIYYGYGSSQPFEKPYQNFIEAIINLNSAAPPSVTKRRKNQPKIIISNLLISEIINAYMRKVAMKSFFGGGETYKSKDFKRDYRNNPHSDYKPNLSDLCYNFSCFKDYTILSDGYINTINPHDIVDDLPSKLADFNDLCFYHYLKDKNIPFITHDRDFKFENLHIITANPELIRISTIK